MEMDELEKLIELMNSNDLVEIEIERGDDKIRLKKAGAVASSYSMAPMPPVAPPAAPVLSPAPASGPVEGDSQTFNSPMVGTFYVSASPGADPFVRVGDKVGQSTVLCIIEAMKVMNEITADMDGEILEILVGNGEGVEYNQPLFTIKPR